MSWTASVDPKDDLFHSRNDDPYWNESHFNVFMAPDSEVMGFIYYYYRPNMNLCVAGPVLFDSSGEQIYNCLYYGWDTLMAIPDGAEMNDASFENGFSVETIELQKKYKFTYDVPDCQLDIQFDSIMEPHYMPLEADNLNPGIRDWVREAGDLSLGHYEQAGMMSGTATVRGVTYEIRGGGIRDHTWGPRKMLTNQNKLRGGYPFVAASRESSFQAYCMAEQPLESDPIVGTTERITSGWYTKNGVQGTLVSGSRRITERGQDGRPVREEIIGRDDQGRELHAECTYLTWLWWPCFSDCVPCYGLVRWEYDGKTELGLNCDYTYYRHNRKLWEAVQDPSWPAQALAHR